MNSFGGEFRGKRVLVTGHTGFKGSWLALWLNSLGAEVTGFSHYLPSVPCNYEVCGLENIVQNITGDIRNYMGLKAAFDRVCPEVVFHLAAQSLVRTSYDDPKNTFDTNVGGTVNVMECIRQTPSVKAAVIITSDKAYKNVEWEWGYRENDTLGGDDPYSASKGAAELIFNSYAQSFFTGEGKCRAASSRAGNVIGGGDWAANRIVPDCVRAFSQGEKLTIRNPHATRPWQHVLEPLSGYLWLATYLLRGKKGVAGESFNFGPLSEVNRTVEELLQEFTKHWGRGKWNVESTLGGARESMLLKLNCDKALFYLNWKIVMGFEETVAMTSDWYKAYYSGEGMRAFTLGQIVRYEKLAAERGLAWA